MNILNINFTSFFLDLTYFSSQFNNDMDVYLIMIIALAILAIGDLVVGVSNDAVNFLNSALGSKVISVRNINDLSQFRCCSWSCIFKWNDGSCEKRNF